MTRLTSQQMHRINGGTMPTNCRDLMNAIAVLAICGQELGAAILLGYYISQGC